VTADLQGAPGLCFAVGIGEAPIGLQGTLSVWQDATSLQQFAYGTPSHRAVIARTPVEKWYAEELFARFAVLDADPLFGIEPPVDTSAEGAVSGRRPEAS
jgi:hypothetical protein